jgi:hypothetical protein
MTTKRDINPFAIALIVFLFIVALILCLHSGALDFVPGRVR